MAQTKAVAKKVKTVADKPFYQKHAFELIVVVFALLLFANSLAGGYNMDDELVTRNHRLTSKGISAIPEIFTSPYYQDDMGYAYEYRPVPLSTFAIEYSMFGDSATAGHFFNWLLYALLCFCLYRLLLTIGGLITPLMALCVTLLFCAHPSHTEVVCSIKNRDEILGLIFCLLSMRTGINAARNNNWWMLPVTGLLFLLAMLCKTTFVPFAFFIPLSIIFFTESTMGFAVLAALLTGIASYFTLNLNPDYYRSWFVLAMVLGVVVSHLFVKNAFRSTFQSLLPRGEDVPTSPGEPFSGLKEWVKGFNLASVITIVPSVIVLLLYKYTHPGVAGTLSLVAVVAAVTAVFYLRGGNYVWLGLFNIALCIFLSFAAIGGFEVGDRHPLVYTLYLSLLFLFWWGAPMLRLPSLLVAGVMAAHFFTDTRSGYVNPFFFLLLSRLVVGRKVIMALLSLELVLVVIWLATGKLQRGEQVIHFAGIAQTILLLLLLNLLNSWKLIASRAAMVVSVISVALMSFMVFNHGLELRSGTELAVKGKPLPNIVESLVETKTDRPIDFVEFPVAPQDPASLRAGTAMVILGHYIFKTILPYPLSFYYGYSYIKPTEISNPKAVAVLIAILLMACVAVYFVRSNKYISFSIVLILVSMLVFSGYFFPVPGIVADRYLLIPSLGWSLLLSLILFKIGNVTYKGVNPFADNFSFTTIAKPSSYCFIITLCLYSAATFARNFDWKNDLTLMRRDVKAVPESSQAHNVLALHLMQQTARETDEQKKMELSREALSEFKKAKEIYPPFFNATYDIARVYLVLNMQDSALQAFKQVIEIEPKFSDSYAQVADIYVRKKQPADAVPYLETFMQRRPYDFAAYDKLSYIFYMLGRYDESIAVNQKAIQKFPERSEPVTNIGQTYLALNKIDSAKVYCQRALTQNPNDGVAKQLQGKLVGK